MRILTTVFNPREFTGWHMFGVLCLFFGTIISVNLTLAFNASTTWTGLMVKNSYVVSQKFNSRVEELAKQPTKDWSAKVIFAHEGLTVVAQDGAGASINDAIVTGQLGRPVHEGADQRVVFVGENGRYTAPLQLDSGLWHVQLTIIGSAGEQWVETIRFVVEKGAEG